MTDDTTPDAAADPARLARALIRRGATATLATALTADDTPGEPPWPYASLVLTAADHDAAPLLMLSSLAEHSRNIAHDDRVSLLFDGTAGLDDPLTGARVTVLGRAIKSDEPRHRARFLARHPSAALYADFGDFAVYAVRAERAHLVAGFGRITWIRARDLMLDVGPHEALIAAESGIVQHMNEDHAEAVALYATALLGRASGRWTMTGIDPEGCDLRREGELARLDFDTPVETPEAARKTLVDLVTRAGSTGGKG